MDWSDVLKLALSIFLIVTGLGLAYLFLRMAGVFQRLGSALTRITDEVVPILNRAQTTVNGVNLELARVDEIMKTAVGATKGAEKTVQTVSTRGHQPRAQAHRPGGRGARGRGDPARAPRRRGGRPGRGAPAPRPTARPAATRGPGAPDPGRASGRDPRHPSPY